MDNIAYRFMQKGQVPEAILTLMALSGFGRKETIKRPNNCREQYNYAGAN